MIQKMSGEVVHHPKVWVHKHEHAPMVGEQDWQSHNTSNKAAMISLAGTWNAKTNP